MNKQELIEHIGNTLDEYLKNTTFIKPVLTITEIANSDKVSLEFEINKNHILLDDISNQFGYEQGKLDGEWVGQQLKPEAGHADEAPRYVKNILARLRELPLHDREVWLKAIMGEFEQDFSLAKWREGYEQGKVEGLIEREKVTVPRYVADWIKYFKKTGDWDLFQAMDDLFGKERKVHEWLEVKHNQELFALAWIFGYTVEKEKKYRVSLKNGQPLVKAPLGGNFYFNQNITGGKYKATRKELEEAGFGWVFDCPGIEIEEVEE